MTKPIVFFSHSSKDKDFLKLLKNKILTKTSNTIEIFQSSDGESIPSGNNWVHKIEEGLKQCRLMFVFVSPNSLKSNWLYFESGYAYSKGINVIPIGINGIDVGILSPPLNLLQGFNISTYEGLNNILNTINKEFNSTYQEDFSLADYRDLVRKSKNVIMNNSHIDYIETKFYSLASNSLKADAFEEIEIFLKNSKFKYTKSTTKIIQMPGMMISQVGVDEIVFTIDQLSLMDNIAILKKLFPVAYSHKIDQFWLAIYFYDYVDLLYQDFKISSILKDCPIEMAAVDEGLYIYKDLLFKIDDLKGFPRYKDEGKRLRIVFNPESFNENNFFELVDLLFEHKVIWVK